MNAQAHQHRVVIGQHIMHVTCLMQRFSQKGNMQSSICDMTCSFISQMWTKLRQLSFFFVASRNVAVAALAEGSLLGGAEIS